MRHVKLSGRESSVLRAVGFSEGMPGAEIQEVTRMDAEDVTDTLNGLLAAGYVESIPYREQIEQTDMPAMTFEVNPAYAHDLKVAILRGR